MHGSADGAETIVIFKIVTTFIEAITAFNGVISRIVRGIIVFMVII
jgi:hypothetical protein